MLLREYEVRSSDLREIAVFEDNGGVRSTLRDIGGYESLHGHEGHRSIEWLSSLEGA